MPKSKRSKVVTLAQTRKKGIEGKSELMDEIKKCVDSYSNLFVFDVHNMRNVLLKELRNQWKPSRFFFGKNKIMSMALNQITENGDHVNLEKVTEQIEGQCGLLFTNDSKEKVVKFFESYVESDYARSGFEATREVTLNAGPLTQFSHSIEPYLRSLGMPTHLVNGVINLRSDYVVCKEGDTLTPDQAKVLKLLEIKMAEFSVSLKCVWHKGEFELLDGASSGNGDADQGDDEDMDD
eukprot:TRINITY_DN7854_c0_g1_i1.p1 TRINITY_DN7854_c0_g1~~TRINITY_DN7854_c0_g1_i1.p1  ORF type:complete len:237 (-),score=47.24 TRINITY_DN7854_c0_g1_i1:35-745(-)